MASQTSDKKPAAVQRAVLCLWISAAAVALLTAVSWVGLLAIPTGVGPTATNLLTFVLLAVVAIGVGARRGWARWLFVAVYVPGTLLLVVIWLLAPQAFLSMPTVLQVSGVVQVGLQTAALLLIFTATSRQWFADKRVAE